MAHRRGLGLRGCGLALALAALASGGCSGGASGVLDGAVTDLGDTDSAKVKDTGAEIVDTGAVDAGDMGDAVDAGALDAVEMLDGAATVDGGDAGGADASDGGATGRGHAGASLVSAGSLMRSSRYEMISTLGGRSVQQTTLQSPNYRLRGGLVGTIGAR